jgi:hypothetical protein
MVIGIFIGATIWLLFELNKAYKKEDFSYGKFIELNWVPLLTNVICGLTILWFREDVDEYFKITKFSSVFLGMTGQGVFKKLIGLFDKNIETKIGINEPENDG